MGDSLFCASIQAQSNQFVDFDILRKLIFKLNSRALKGRIYQRMSTGHEDQVEIYGSIQTFWIFSDQVV